MSNEKEELKNTGNIKRLKQRYWFGGTRSLRTRLILVMIVGWLVPVTIIFAFMTFSYRDSIIIKTESILVDSLKNFAYSISLKMNEAIQISKKVSYEKEIEDAWKEFNDSKINQARLYSTVMGVLNSKFKNDKRFVMSYFYFTGKEDNPYSTYRETDHLTIYKNEVHNEVLKIGAENSSDAKVKIINGRIYIIRNLYTTTGYKKFGTLTVELNKSVLFEDTNINNETDMAFFINKTDSNAIVNTEAFDADMEDIFEEIKATYQYGSVNKADIIKKDKYAAILYQKKDRDFHIGAYMILDQNKMYDELGKLYQIMINIWIIIIPILVLLYLFLRSNITVPMTKMIKIAKEVRKGKIGVQIEDCEMPNLEFEELKVSFNRMSTELKNMFDYAYNEELARKDAKIIALQSQINPHFLNNTLEMMNWQARMAGDITVSRMIEALGTLLDYNLDRSNRRMISLAEELRCADAYFYIISMRFGQRLVVEKQVDESLLQTQVPQLILQPILENAVVHGVEAIKRGNIWLKIYKENDNLIMSIINTGKDMTSADIQRVEDILSGKYKSNNEEVVKRVSLGIHNVNERIQLIYGEEYGLTIRPLSEGKTISTITLPFERKIDNKKEDMYKNLMKEK